MLQHFFCSQYYEFILLSVKKKNQSKFFYSLLK